MSFLSAFFKVKNTRPTGGSEDLQKIREDIFQFMLVIASITGTIAYFSGIYVQVQRQAWLVIILETVAYGWVLLITLYKRFGYKFRVLSLLALLFMLGISRLLENGLDGDGNLYMMAFMVLGVILLEFRLGIWLSALTLAGSAVIAFMFIQGSIPPPDPATFSDSTRLSDWIMDEAGLILFTALVISSTYSLIRGLENALNDEKKMTVDLEDQRIVLEQQVIRRTDELEKRAKFLDVANEFASEISKLNDTNKMLDLTISYFQFRLGFSDVVIFFTDEKKEFLGIQTAAGSIGQELFDQKIRYSFSQPGTLADLLRSNKGRVLYNNGEDAKYFRSIPSVGVSVAIFLPFRISETMSGALFLPSRSKLEITYDDLKIMQGIVDQFGASLGKARTLSILNANLEELEKSSRQTIQYSWRSYLKTRRRRISYRYTNDVIEADVPAYREDEQAIKDGQVVVTEVESNETEAQLMTAVAAPIILRNQPLGVVNIRFASKKVSPDIVNLIEATAERLAIALENARLMDEMKQSAERERTVSNISTRVRASSDIDSILKTAAQELGRSLGATEVLVQLRKDNE